MNFVKKAAVFVAATSMVVAPVAVSAAQNVESVRAVSSVSDESELAGNGLILAILAGIAVVVGIILIADDDKPTSP